MKLCADVKAYSVAVLRASDHESDFFVWERSFFVQVKLGECILSQLYPMKKSLIADLKLRCNEDKPIHQLVSVLGAVVLYPGSINNFPIEFD